MYWRLILNPTMQAAISQCFINSFSQIYWRKSRNPRSKIWFLWPTVREGHLRSQKNTDERPHPEMRWRKARCGYGRWHEGSVGFLWCSAWIQGSSIRSWYVKGSWDGRMERDFLYKICMRCLRVVRPVTPQDFFARALVFMPYCLCPRLLWFSIISVMEAVKSEIYTWGFFAQSWQTSEKNCRSQYKNLQSGLKWTFVQVAPTQ